MIRGGTATIFVSNMDKAVRFYSETLGLKLRGRYGDHYAEVDAGEGFTIGLHPEDKKKGSLAGKPGSTIVGLGVTEAIETVMESLKKRGVNFTGRVQLDPKSPVKIAYLNDPDGNELYLCETSYGPKK